jgi:hypothetical protein
LPAIFYYPLVNTKMSTYTPGTILSVGFGPTLEQVIVLTEDKVATKTFGGQPVIRRDIMSLQDWQIVVGSQVIQTDSMPVPAAVTEPAAVAEPVPAAVTEPVPMAEPVPAAVAVQESYPVGTKLSWKHPDGSDQWYSPNSRTAIVLKGGIVLQVKEVINGITSRIRKNDGYQEFPDRSHFGNISRNLSLKNLPVEVLGMAAMTS